MADVTLVLAAPSINAALLSEIDELGFTLKPLGNGYFQATSSPIKLLLVDLTAVAEHEDDDFLRWFGRNRARTREVLRWAEQNSHTPRESMDPQELEDYEDFARKIAESLTVEQRLAGIAPEELVLALPDDALSALSEEYIATLSDDVQRRVRQRRHRA